MKFSCKSIKMTVFMSIQSLQLLPVKFQGQTRNVAAGGEPYHLQKCLLYCTGTAICITYSYSWSVYSNAYLQELYTQRSSFKIYSLVTKCHILSPCARNERNKKKPIFIDQMLEGETYSVSDKCK